MVVEMHTWSPDWKRVSIITITITTTITITVIVIVIIIITILIIIIIHVCKTPVHLDHLFVFSMGR